MTPAMAELERPVQIDVEPDLEGRIVVRVRGPLDLPEVGAHPRHAKEPRAMLEQVVDRDVVQRILGQARDAVPPFRQRDLHRRRQRKLGVIYDESLAAAFQYAKTAALDTDHIYTRGTQEYELRGGRGSGATPC